MNGETIIVFKGHCIVSQEGKKEVLTAGERNTNSSWQEKKPLVQEL